MAFLLKDRVKTTSTTTGTGTLTISTTAPTGYQNATAVGDGNTATWVAAAGSEWEVFIGTVGSSGTTLTRDTVLANHLNTTALVNFSAGTKDVWCDVAASYLMGQSHFCYLNADYTLTSTTASQKLFNTTANGTLTLPETGLYAVEGQIYIDTMSATSGNGAVSIIGAGTATLSGQLLAAVGVDNSSPTAASGSAGYNFALAASAFTTNTVTAQTGTAMGATINGIFKCTATGTLIPSIALVTAAAAVVKAGSWIRLSKLAPPSSYTQGNWS